MPVTNPDHPRGVFNIFTSSFYDDDMFLFLNFLLGVLERGGGESIVVKSLHMRLYWEVWYFF
jgi:hypothetical protein